MHDPKNYVIVLRNLKTGEWLGNWNGSNRWFVKDTFCWKYTKAGAKSVCTKTVYPLMSDNPMGSRTTVTIELHGWGNSRQVSELATIENKL